MLYLAGAIYLLKITSICTGVGFVSTLLLDKDIHKIIGGLKLKKVTKVKGYHIENEHCTILGKTQYGKTFGLIQTLDKMKESILFFNTNDTSLKGSKSNWIEGNGAHSLDQIIYGLKNGYKINFIPSDDMDKMEKQLKAITDEIYKQGRFSFRFAVDEVHLFKKEGKQALIRLASTGLGKGYKCMFITQRPAMCDNSLFTQSNKHIIFALGLNDYSYLKGHGFPSEKIVEMINNEKYRFCEFDQTELKGAFMIG